jgi:hypothetical protein
MAVTLFVKKPERVEALLFYHDTLVECLCSHRVSHQAGTGAAQSYFAQSSRKVSQKTNGSVYICCFTSIMVLYINQTPKYLT